MKYILTTIAEIKAAVDRGVIVYVASDSYRVIKDSIGQYLIKCDFNDHCIGLHGQEGTEYANHLNGTSFYIIEKAPSVFGDSQPDESNEDIAEHENRAIDAQEKSHNQRGKL